MAGASPSRRAVLAGGAASLAAPPAVAAPSFPGGATAARRIERARVEAGDGRALRLDLSVPAGPAPRGGFPALVVLDGNAWFAVAAALAEAREDELGPIAVLGVGYDIPGRFDSRRLRDLTPFPPRHPLGYGQDGLPVGGGGAFTEVLCGPLMAEAGRRAPLAQHGRTLFGHSLGGLLVLHLLFTRTSAFDAYVAASPSIWWDRDRLLAEAAALRPPAPRLLITVGGEEDHLTPAAERDLSARYAADPRPFAARDEAQAIADYRRLIVAHRMTANARELAAALKARDLPAAFARFPGEDHNGSAPVALNRALGFAIG